MAKRTNDTSSTTPDPTRRRIGGTRTTRKNAVEALHAVADRRLDTVAGYAASSPSRDAIARRAYELYVRRGGTNGHDVDDWLEAERQLRGAENR